MRMTGGRHDLKLALTLQQCVCQREVIMLIGCCCKRFVMDLAVGTTTGIDAHGRQATEDFETTRSGRNSLPEQLRSARPPHLQPFGRRWTWPLALLPVDLAAGTVPVTVTAGLLHLQASAIPAGLQANNLQQHRRPLHHVCAANLGKPRDWKPCGIGQFPG